MDYISEEQVKKLLNWDDTFCAIEVALESVTKKRVFQNPRTITGVLNTDNRLFAMPAYLEHDKFGALACKLVTACSGNANLRVPLPVINGNIMLFDESTGILKAVIAATEITTWRTVAASIVATKHLTAKKTQRHKVLAILGCGVQGKIHAEAFGRFFDFQEIRLWNHKAEKATRLAKELNAKCGQNVFKYFENNEECVKDADIIVTATFASEPIVQWDWVKKGAHINAVGAGTVNHHTELEEKIYFSSDVYLDHWPGAKTELSALLAKGVEFKGEIGSVIAGDLAAPDSNSNRVTVFQSLGMAVEDCAMARLIYDLYKKSQN